MHDAAWLLEWPNARRDEPMSRHSQYGIGGPADWYVRVGDATRLADLLSRCHGDGVPVTVVGAGSNTLILDGGIRGVVVELMDKSMRVVGAEKIEVGAGAMMPRLALDCAKRGLAGLEFGIGVPGTAGASVRGNAGAFGREMRDVVVDVTALDGQGAARRFTAAACEFAYRTSVFKARLHDHIVVGAHLRVEPDDPVAVRARTDEIQAERKASQPYGIRSLGSVFTNPPGDHAGRLLDVAGLKGTRHGGAEISSKHANFIVNVDNATAADVLALVEVAQRRVRETFGIELEREIVVLGEAAAAPAAGERG